MSLKRTTMKVVVRFPHFIIPSIQLIAPLPNASVTNHPRRGEPTPFVGATIRYGQPHDTVRGGRCVTKHEPRRLSWFVFAIALLIPSHKPPRFPTPAAYPQRETPPWTHTTALRQVRPTLDEDDPLSAHAPKKVPRTAQRRHVQAHPTIPTVSG